MRCVALLVNKHTYRRGKTPSAKEIGPGGCDAISAMLRYSTAKSTANRVASSVKCIVKDRNKAGKDERKVVFKFTRKRRGDRPIAPDIACNVPLFLCLVVLDALKRGTNKQSKQVL